MAFNYPGLQATATRLLTDAGMPMLLREMVSSGPGYDPVLMPVDHECIGVVGSYRKAEIDGERVLRTDKKVFLTANGEVPTTKHRLVIEGVPHSIIDVDIKRPAAVALVYIVQARI